MVGTGTSAVGMGLAMTGARGRGAGVSGLIDSGDILSTGFAVMAGSAAFGSAITTVSSVATVCGGDVSLSESSKSFGNCVNSGASMSSVVWSWCCNNSAGNALTTSARGSTTAYWLFPLGNGRRTALSGKRGSRSASAMVMRPMASCGMTQSTGTLIVMRARVSGAVDERKPAGNCWEIALRAIGIVFHSTRVGVTRAPDDCPPAVRKTARNRWKSLTASRPNGDLDGMWMWGVPERRQPWLARPWNCEKTAISCFVFPWYFPNDLQGGY